MQTKSLCLLGIGKSVAYYRNAVEYIGGEQ